MIILPNAGVISTSAEFLFILENAADPGEMPHDHNCVHTVCECIVQSLYNAMFGVD